jgi:hypothetical protein
VLGQATKVTLNRLEVDDVMVTGSGAVRGTYRVEVDTNDGWVTLNCRDAPTHTGLDVPDGRYRVTAKTTTPSGPITNVQEVTFP